MCVLFLFFYIVSQTAPQAVEGQVLRIAGGGGGRGSRPFATLAVGRPGEVRRDDRAITLEGAVKALRPLQAGDPEGALRLQGGATPDYRWSLTVRSVLGEA